MTKFECVERVKNLSLKQLLETLGVEEKSRYVKNLDYVIIGGSKLHIPLKFESVNIANNKENYIVVDFNLSYRHGDVYSGHRYGIIFVEIIFPRIELIGLTNFINTERIIKNIISNVEEKSIKCYPDKQKLVFTKDVLIKDDENLETIIKDAIYEYLLKLIQVYVVPFICELEEEIRIISKFSSIFNKSMFFD